MFNNNYSFSVFNDYTHFFITDALTNLCVKTDLPIIVCIGSDLVLGDSLGPLVGTKLASEKIGTYVYGSLGKPVTAKEISYLNEYLKKTHPNRQILAIDAAVGAKEDVGQIKIFGHGIKPGLGFNKNLDLTGDISIIGIVAEKSDKNYKLLNNTRLNLVYKMATAISTAVKNYAQKQNRQNYLFAQ